jgi:hypothetical protein
MNQHNTTDTELLEFLSLEFPLEIQREDGFMDIVGVQYHENTITQIYAYFLNTEINPEISRLFLDSLLEVIASKDNRKIDNLEFDDFKCNLEVVTSKGNRVDLVIESKTEDEFSLETKSALIIENKIYSGVWNDLQDYYESNNTNVLRKQGILLTLKKHKISDDLKDIFINVTHSEWIDQIKSNGLPSNLSLNKYVYLNDFINNMENLTQSNSMNEDAKFFFKHASKVLRAKKTHDEAYIYVINQLKIVAEKIGWKFYGNSSSWRHIWDADKEAQVYFSLVFENIISEQPEITIYLEIYKDALNRYDEFSNLLNENGFFNNLTLATKSTRGYAHLAYKTYKLDFSQIEDLSGYIYDKLNEDFIIAYKLIESNIKLEN